MRSRQHVVIARLNDEEYEVYEDILRKGIRHSKGYPRNRSQRFRLVLKVIDKMLKREAFEHLYTEGLDF